MKKVLVVDDVLGSIELLRFDLEDDGFEVIGASSGLECLKLAPLVWPDIILLDIQMPGIDGIATLSRLKTNPITSDIPVITVSVDQSIEAIIQSLDIGAHDYVRKPIEYAILAARMRSAIKLTETQRKLEHANKKLEHLATQDPLTDTNNRRSFIKLSGAEFSKCRRHGHTLSLLMLDADNFKNINDKYGHAAGDVALKHLVDTCKTVCRETDIIGRIGGEEFAICCPDTGLEGAQTVAERIRQACESSTIEVESSQDQFSYTVSIGVTSLAEDDTDIIATLGRADILLYQAKHKGRNRSIASLNNESHNEIHDELHNEAPK